MNPLLKRKFAYQNKIPGGRVKNFWKDESCMRMLKGSENTVKNESAIYNTELIWHTNWQREQMASDSNVGGKSLAEDDKLGLDLLPESDFLGKREWLLPKMNTYESVCILQW